MELVDVEGLNSDTGDESISIGSDEDSTESFTLLMATSRLVVGSANSSPPNLNAGTNLHETCKREAAKFGIIWPEALTSSARQLLLVFPECLEEAN